MTSTNTYRRGNVEIVVYRPSLTDDERRKREETLRRAMTAFGKTSMRQKENEVIR